MTPGCRAPRTAERRDVPAQRDQRTSCSKAQSRFLKRFCRSLKCHLAVGSLLRKSMSPPWKGQPARASGHKGRRLGCGAGAILSTSSPGRRRSGRTPGGLRAALSVKGGDPGGWPQNSGVLGSLRQGTATESLPAGTSPERASLIHTPPTQDF